MPSVHTRAREVALLRNALKLDEYAPINAFAAAVGHSQRTVRRMNLPRVRIGKVDYIHIHEARERLFGAAQREGSLLTNSRRSEEPGQARGPA